MVLAIIIGAFTCLTLILSVLFKPTIKIKKFEIQTFWLVCLIGALLILLLGIVPLDVLINSLKDNTTINPFKILILFISLSMISITLDALGFFKYLALKVTNKSKSSQYKLFFSMYALIALLTVFTSNDIVILTFTPFICYFAKNAKINPIPYLVMEFIVANTYSMALYIGNPTNIYLSQSAGITFIEYFKVMFIPAILAGITSMILLLTLFRKDLNKPLSNTENEECVLENKSLTFISLVILAACTVLLAISNYIDIQMWLVCLVSASLLTLILVIYLIKGKNLIKDVYKRLPYNLIAFVLSMYVLVLSLNETGATEQIANFISKITTNDFSKVFVYGSISTISDNLINNIPMSILFSSIVSMNYSSGALYATIIGSNIGAYLTPIGALAGIMWMSILKKHEINYNFKTFTKYGLIMVPPVLIVSLLSLLVML